MESQTELLQQVVDLLTLIAEPQIAARDEKRRAALIEIVGKGALKAKAVSLMDGKKPPVTITKESGIDQGGLSRLMKALREAELLGPDEKAPKLSIPLPPGFLDKMGK